MNKHLNRVVGRFSVAILLLAAITACQSVTDTTITPPLETPNTLPAQEQNTTQITDYASIPTGDIKPDVLSTLVATRAANPSAVAQTTALNLLANPSFESGANSWVACDAASSLQPSNDSIDGLALSLGTGCMYQDVIVQPEKVYTLSCKAKLTDPTGWSGIGFGIMDSTFTPLVQAPENQITGTEWVDYISTFTTPENSGFAAIWVYTDGTLNIDDCSFSTETEETQAPDPTTLIPNGSFDSQSNWSNCGDATAYSISSGNLNMDAISCVYQTIEATVGADYRLSCNSKGTAGVYASISLSMLNSNWAPIATDSAVVTSNTFATLDLALEAPTQSKYVAVTFYSEGITTHENCFLTINTVVNPVPLPDGSLFPYPNSHPTDNEAAQVSNNLLTNPSFTNQTGWTNCAPNNATIANGKLNASPGICFFQQINAEVGKTYTLTCKGSMDLPLYSVFTLNMLDVNYQSLDTEIRTLNTNSRQWRIALEAPVNTAYVTVGFYTETGAIYDYCYLTTATPAPTADEFIYAPVKPLELMVPIYIDPAQDAAPWNKVIAAAQKVPTTVVVNPVIGDIEGCQEATFKTMLGKLQTNNVDTVGYIPTGYTATPAATVKERIDRFKTCEGIDGVFFDEIKVSNQAEADYYTDICTYAKQAFGPGKFVVNAGTNIQIPITNEYCNVALINEFYETFWKDFAVFGYQGANTDAATSIMLHTSNTFAKTKEAIDLSYARKIDYVFITDATVPNPWLDLGSFWTQMVDYIALKNTPFN